MYVLKNLLDETAFRYREDNIDLKLLHYSHLVIIVTHKITSFSNTYLTELRNSFNNVLKKWKTDFFKNNFPIRK